MLLTVLGGAPAVAATYYVDPAGSNEADGSAESPWRSIQRAARLLLPGDTLLIQAGVYVESVTVSASGTAEAPIRFEGVGEVVLESPDPSASLSAFDVQPGVGYLVLDGFEARGGFHETIFVRSGAHDIVIRNCEVHDNRVGIWLADATDVLVDDCHIHRNLVHGLRVLGNSQRITIRNTTSADNDDGLGCSGDADGFAVEETSADVTFIDCLAHDNGEDGFDLQGDNVRLVNVESRHNRCAGVKVYQNAVVENALVVENQTGIITTSFYGSLVNVDLLNSTFADNAGTQVFLRSPGATDYRGSGAYAVRMRNVIAYGPGKAVEVAWPVILEEDHNVLFRDDTTSGVLVRHLSDSTERRYSGQEINAGVWKNESGQGTGTWAIDPELADRETYRVAPDSVAVDAGAAEAAPERDRQGVVRPLGRGVDIGPDEWEGMVTNHRPWADLGPDRLVVAGAAVRLSAFGSVDPDGDPLSYLWDFGDGSDPEVGFEVVHRYAEAGEYSATLTVSDGSLSHADAALVTVLPAPSPTPTRSDDDPTPAALVHDSELRPFKRPLKVRLGRGKESRQKKVRVVVRNADVLPVRERPGHEIHVITEAGSCPAGTVLGSPDFTRRQPGDQDKVIVAGGRRKRAVVLLHIDRAAFHSPSRDAPHRCRLRFTSVGPGTDPTPENNVAELELEVVDKNDF